LWIGRSGVDVKRRGMDHKGGCGAEENGLPGEDC